MSKPITESEVEQAVLGILKDLGYKTLWGPDIAPAPDGVRPERKSYADVVLVDRLKEALERINPAIPVEAREEAIKKVLPSESQSLVVDNQGFHKMIVEGIDVEYRKGGQIVGDKVWLIDFGKLSNNEFLAVNQFTVIENNYNRRPDIVLFINGLPLGAIELKNPAGENATVRSAFNQFETYKAQIPSLFRFNEILVISDGLESKAGTITSDWERFLPWKTIDGEEIAPRAIPEIEVLLRGMLNKQVLLDLVRRLHTMYVDKPMKGHGLMQAIARVNRVFKDKPGGLIVDYLGIADDLKKALSEYTESGGKGKPAFDQQEAVTLMLEKYEVVCGMLHGFDCEKFFSVSVRDKMSIMALAAEHILKQKDGKERFLGYVSQLSKAFALAVPNEEALKIRDDAAFFQAVRSRLAKFEIGTGKTDEELDSAIKQIISKAVVSDKVIDIFAAAGIRKPDISILSDEFLAEVKGMPHKNLALELLKKLLNDEIKARSRKNLIQGRSFAEMLEKSIRKLQNKALDSAQIIEELIELAKKMRQASNRGEELGLGEDELAFYDTLEVNDSAVKVLGDETLRAIARELVQTVKNNVTIDWTLKESIQAKLRVMVKRILRKYGYPPDKQQKATETVLEQAALICKDWAEISQ